MAIIDQAGTNFTTNHTYEPADVNLPIDDEDEFKARMQAWTEVGKIINAIFRTNVALAVIFSVLGIVLFLVIFNESVRRKSPLWYWFHILALSVYCGLFIHVPGYMGNLSDNKSFCRYIMYSPEYVFTLIAFLLILLNIEVLFSYILQMKLWQDKQVIRFVVSVLLAWLVTTFIVAHVTIENNIIDKKRRFCFRLHKEAVKPRLALRDWFPCVVCFLSSAAILVVFCLRKAQPRFISAMGNLREITTLPDDNGDKLQIVLMTLFMNVLFILRVVLYVVVRFRPIDRILKHPTYYIKFSVIMLFHSQILYILPFPALLLPEVRSALYHFGSRCLKVIVGPFKGRISDESSSLPVRFGDVKE